MPACPTGLLLQWLQSAPRSCMRSTRVHALAQRPPWCCADGREVLHAEATAA